MSVRSHRHIALVETPPKMAVQAPRKARMPTEAGLPPKPEEMTWRDYLIMLLHIAAELEHALMVEYLYAAYSLGGPGAAKHPQVRKWRDSILTIAREEMGHLLTVQNTLLLIGGPVSFERSDYPWSSPFYPFEFSLEPLSLKSLARYVFAEMPGGKLDNELDRHVRRDVLDLLDGAPGTRVGEVYDRIIALIGNTELIPEETFEPDSLSYQANWDEWGRGYRPGASPPYTKNPDIPPPYERKTRVIVARMATRTEAVQGLRDVAGQGEAEHLRGDKVEPSHFDRFAEIFLAFQAIRKKDPTWSPSRPIAQNPFAGEAEFAPRGSTPITSDASRVWASLFNVRYRMLLTLLTYTFRLPRDAPETSHLRRAPMMARIFGEMYNLKALAGILVRLPLGSPKEPPRAGPPFQMPYTLVPPSPEANFWRMQADLLVASDALAERLLDPKRHGLPTAPPDGVRYLTALRGIDRSSRAWIEQLLDGINPSRRTRV